MKYMYLRRSVVRKMTEYIWMFTIAALAELYWFGILD